METRPRPALHRRVMALGSERVSCTGNRSSLALTVARRTVPKARLLALSPSSIGLQQRHSKGLPPKNSATGGRSVRLPVDSSAAAPKRSFSFDRQLLVSTDRTSTRDSRGGRSVFPSSDRRRWEGVRASSRRGYPIVQAPPLSEASTKDRNPSKNEREQIHLTR